ncbi:hypothetical protein ACRN9J_13440 [Shewanella baltica]|uniref:hypothetical protein n=1 Tax=Shewanella baltica TaxID=62322 RepID=UPI003D7ADB8F
MKLNHLALSLICILPVFAVCAADYEELNQKCITLQKGFVNGDLNTVLSYYHPDLEKDKTALNLLKKRVKKKSDAQIKYQRGEFSTIKILSSQEEAITERDHRLPYDINQKIGVRLQITFVNDELTWEPYCLFIHDKTDNNWYVIN